MKYHLITICSFLFSSCVFAEAITCADVTAVKSEAKIILHAAAQKRAQKEAEDLLEKKIATPYLDVLGQSATPEAMASLIEVYWCESPSTPLHSAYFRFYTSNKHVFE